MSYKWWRISNITTRTAENSSIYTVYKLLFITREGVVGNKVANAQVESIASGDISDILDDTLLTTSIQSAPDKYKKWWFTYVFDTPQILSEIIYLAGYGNGQEWQTAHIEYSTDGVSWNLWEKVFFNVPDNTSTERIHQLALISNNTQIPKAKSNFNINSQRPPSSSYNITHLAFVNNNMYSIYARFNASAILSKIYPDSMVSTLKTVHSNVQLANGANMSMLGRPSYVGKGAFSGATYEGDLNVMIESEVYAAPSTTPWIKFTTTTIDGKYTISKLNTDVLYDVYAKPVTGQYQTKIASNLKPSDNISSYDYNIRIMHDDIVYQNIPYKFKVHVIDGKGDTNYAISNGTSGVSINSDGIVTFSSGITGPIRFNVEASDSILSVTKSSTVELNVVPVSYYNLPLALDGKDLSTNVMWDEVGTVEHIDGYARFDNISHYKSDMSLKLENEFSISFSFVKYSFINNDFYNSTVFHTGDHTKPNDVFFIKLFSEMSGNRRLFIKGNGSTQYTGRHSFSEYIQYDVFIMLNRNTLSMYINGSLDYTVQVAVENIDKIRAGLANPARIGYTATTLTNQRKEMFGGLIKDFKIVNGRASVDNMQVRENVNFGKYSIKPSVNCITNYYELPITNTTTYNSTDDCLIFNNSSLIYPPSLTNILRLDTFEMELDFTLIAFGSAKNSFLMGTINKTTNVKKGWALMISPDGLRIDTTYNLHHVPFNVVLGQRYKFNIHGYTTTNRMDFSINDVVLSSISRPGYSTVSILTDIDSNFSIGRCTNVDSFNGKIYGLSITNYTI